MDKAYEVQVLIRTDERGLWATVAELPGVFAAGSTYEELLECLNEAIGLYLDETGVPPDLAEQRVQVRKFTLQRNRLASA